MTRAMDISLFIIILTAAMSFVANIGLFTDNQLSTVSQDQITTYNVTDLNSFSNGLSANSPPSITDVIGISIYWLWEAFVIMISIVFMIVVSYYPLVNTFHVPVVLAIFLQGGIYFCYAVFYAQWKSGKGTKLYDY